MNKRHLFRHLAAILGLLAPAVSFAGDGTIGFSGKIVAKTCTTSTTNVNATANKVFDLNVLREPGSTSEWGRNFTISVRCSGTASYLYLSFEDATTPSNLTQTLTLTPDSTASGMGIELWQNVGTSTAYQYYFTPGKDSRTPRSDLTTFPGAKRINYVFSWRFVRTSGDLKPGDARGKATFTMQYQ